MKTKLENPLCEKLVYVNSKAFERAIARIYMQKRILDCAHVEDFYLLKHSLRKLVTNLVRTFIQVTSCSIINCESYYIIKYKIGKEYTFAIIYSAYHTVLFERLSKLFINKGG